MKRSAAMGAALCGALAFASVGVAQRSTPREPAMPLDDRVGVTVALNVGGQAYRFSGRGACAHEPRGYIYMVPAQLWSVQHDDGAQNVTLTFWRPASGTGDMFTLYVRAGGKTHMTDTVKTKHGGAAQGSGEVRFAAAGGGGTFTVNATAASGVRIGGTIRCDRFRATLAEGGD